MDRPVRIAFFSEHASPAALLGGVDAGGQNVYVDEVSRNLARRGYAVDVFTRRDNPTAPEIIKRAHGVRIVHLAAGPAQPLLKDELWPYMPEFRDAFLRFMLREDLRYNLLHGNFWMSGWVVAELGQRLYLPSVQIFHAMGKTKKKYQQEVDTSPDDRIQVETEVIRTVDRLIAQCPGEYHELVDDYGADPKRVITIPSAVNTRVFRPVTREEARRRIGLPQDEFVIVYVGRVIPRKDPRNIVRAIARLQSWSKSVGCTRKIRLLIVGGETVEPNPQATPEIGELANLARELGVLDQVQFVGKRSQDTLRYYYSAGNVAVTTPWYEPFGLTPLEAMACGRPVIGSAVGGITSTIADGETGFLVPPRDPEQLATRLYQFLMEPELEQRMGQAARLRVEQGYTWPIVALRTASLYETLLAAHTKQPRKYASGVKGERGAVRNKVGQLTRPGERFAG